MNRKTVKENTRCFKSAVDLQLGTQIIKSPTHSSRRSCTCLKKHLLENSCAIKQTCMVVLCGRDLGGVPCQQCQSAGEKRSLAPGKVGFRCRVNIDQGAKDASNRLKHCHQLLFSKNCRPTPGRKSITLLKNANHLIGFWPLG